MQNAVWQRLALLSEHQLRTGIIIPMLERTSGLQQITDVHGVNERGLDVIFFTVDQIRRTCYGMQIKRGDIAGGASQDKTVKEIIDQLDLATQFRHPVAVPPSGEFNIERFIVATNGRISGTARAEIATRTRPTPVDFWDLGEIVRRAQSVLPEVLQNQDHETVNYLKFIEARCETLDALDQVTGVESRRLSEVFVEPLLRRRFDPELADSGGQGTAPHSHASPALTVLDDGHDAVLIGEQNEGKTACLRMAAIRRVQRLLQGDTELGDTAQMPVLVSAGKLVAAGALHTAIAEILERGGARRRAKTVLETQDLRPYLVMLDGFSELPSPEDKRRCADLLETARARGGPRLIVAARPDEFLRPGLFDRFRHYTILDFNQGQVRSLIRKWTHDTVELQDVAEKMVSRVREALQLPGSPIPAIIGVMLYEKEHKFITNTAEAVDRYMVIRLGRYAHEMGVRMQVEWQRKQDLLAEVAFAMVEQGLERIPVPNAVRLMDEVYGRLGERPMSQVALDELVEAGVLDRVGDELSFYRTAFRDFFAAKHIANSPEAVEAFFQEHLFDRRWGQALVFAAGLRRHNTALLLRLDSGVRNEREQLSVSGVGEDYLYGAYLLGRILSNSDAANQQARRAVLRTAVKAANESAAILADEAEAQFGRIGQLVAIVGTEQTLLVAVGVPWLAKQFLDLSSDDELLEEERYLLTSVYVHLGCHDWIEAFKRAVSIARSPRVIAALMILAHIMDLEREFRGSALEKWEEVKRALARKRRKFGESVSALFKLKGPLLEIERKRLLRLQKGKS